MSQIITVTFAQGQYEAVADQPLAQWAYGQKLKFVGLELPAAYAVDFSNWEFQGDSIQRIGNADGVAVPTEILTSGRNVYAFIWITDANSGRRRYMAMARVIPGPGPDPEEPNPQESSEISEVLAELNAAVETAEDAASRGPQIRDGYWYTWNAESQEYENTDVPSTGNKIWWTTSNISTIPGSRYVVLLPNLNGPAGVSPAVSDLVVGPAPNTSGSATYLYYIFSIDTALQQVILKSIGSIKGAQGDPGNDGYSPEVTITEIDGGHRVTITDEEHPQGQTFDVMDGQGGSGSSDYDDLTNKPQIAGVTLRGDKSLADLGIAPAGAYVKPSGGIPKSDLASDVQNSLSVVIDFEYVGLDSDGTTQILSTNVTPSEINSAYQAGRVVMARYADGEIIMPLCAVGEGLTMVIFAAEFNGSEEMIWSEDLTDNAVWYYGSTYMIPPLLRPGHADDGKIQVANNGVWTAAQPTIPTGQLDNTSTATVMTATVPGITELRDGVCVWLTNGVVASASGVTLNINALGAKPIYNSLSGAVVTTTFVAASTYLFVYNSTRVTGGCWDMVYGYDANTTYTPAKLGQGYAVCSTAAATAAKTASISSYALTAGGIVAIKFANDVPAGATLNISSKGAKAIYYKGAAITAGVIKAGDTVTMIYSTYYHVLSIDRDVDTLPPSPSDDTPSYIVDDGASPGTSTEYARADHTHLLGLATFETLLENLPAANVPVILYDANNNGVVIQQSPQNLMNIYRHQPKLNLTLIVPPNYNNYPVIFTVSSLNTTTGELHLTGITGGVLYEATLLPGLDPIDNDGIAMVGTMTTTNLALPNAQGVSF